MFLIPTLPPQVEQAVSSVFADRSRHPRSGVIWTMLGRRISDLATRLLPLGWAAFAVQVVTGVLLFSSEAVKV